MSVLIKIDNREEEREWGGDKQHTLAKAEIFPTYVPT
jgi:hypothetical protein